MPISEYFSSSYKEAREKFITAAHQKQATLFSYELPTYTGPQGEKLAIDIAKIGHQEAEQALLLISGTHGVEGFTGSGCQVGFLSDELYAALPPNTCTILVHAVNPYGFAWIRRVNEDNIDLNRNFKDFSDLEQLPDSSAYGELHPLLVPEEWEGNRRQAADLGIQQYIIKNGMQAFQKVVQRGQYSWPTGLFYGGVQEAWSTKTFRQLLRDHIPSTSKKIVSIDIHTGLGPKGYGEPIFIGKQKETFDRAKRWFGLELTSPVNLFDEEKQEVSTDITSVTANVYGSLSEALEPLSASTQVTPISLEFGTVPVTEVLTALRADHWLHAIPNRKTSLDAAIKQQLLNAFYVNTPAWKAAVYGRTADFVLRAGRGLAIG